MDPADYQDDQSLAEELAEHGGGSYRPPTDEEMAEASAAAELATEAAGVTTQEGAGEDEEAAAAAPPPPKEELKVSSEKYHKVNASPRLENLVSPEADRLNSSVYQRGIDLSVPI
jgi:hypothetical protein